ELGLGDILAAQHAVGIEHTDLDMGQAPLLDDLAGIGSATDVFRLQRHETSSPDWPHSALALARLSNQRKRKGRRGALSPLDPMTARLRRRPSPRPRSPPGAER